MSASFTGHEFDEETELSYMGVRYYPGSTGRFISQDPVSFALGDWKTVQEKTGYKLRFYIENPQTQNSYSYVANNPIKYVDKNGEYVELAISGQVGPFGAAVGLRTGIDGINLNLSASGGFGLMADVEGAYVPGVPVNDRIETSIGRHVSFAAGAGIQYSKEGKLDLNRPISLPENTQSSWSVLAGLGGEVTQDYSISIPVVRFNRQTNQQVGALDYVSWGQKLTNLYKAVQKLSDTINKTKDKN